MEMCEDYRIEAQIHSQQRPKSKADASIGKQTQMQFFHYQIDVNLKLSKKVRQNNCLSAVKLSQGERLKIDFFFF